ncbi:DUF5777 family beta-barrel protein [Flavobacterium sp.]|uniref:DUF5777 family beta-barrel protein n=1 Tax=Flavobacterium sp. TaxID=239 RepID=UPI00286EA96C|nr:DUF5777 family beta-barrel protein [Flavobacterium sp.]
MKYLLSFLLVTFSVGFACAQDDLLNQLDAQKTTEKEITPAAFKGLQICNMQSTKLPAQGEWYVLISHRFGDITKGFDNFFGLDEAMTKIGGIYGVTNWLSLGVSRHRNNKTYEMAAKYKFANQLENGFPVTIVGYNTMDIRSDKFTVLYPDAKFNNRLAYTTQLLVSRKFSEKFSFELTPIWVHKNLYDGIEDQKNLLLIGSGARYKIAKRMSVNLEYAARVNLAEGFTSPYHNPLSLGLDIETGGHVFQLVFSNSQPMNDITVFSNSSGRWDGNKQLYFGFNMYRVF